MPPIEQITTTQAIFQTNAYYVLCAGVFLIGTFLGSFFNVAIYRIPAGLSVSNPKRSFCFRCGSQVLWWQNIPVLSYFLLRGKCGSCGAPFSARYAAVELLTGALFLAIFVTTNPYGSETFQWATLWYLAFAGLLVVGTFTDIDHWIIPDGVTLGGAAAALVAAGVIGVMDNYPLLSQFGPLPVVRERWGLDGLTMFISLMHGPQDADILPSQIHWWEPLANAALGAAFGSALLYSIGVLAKMILQKDAMGMGDVKLFAMIGATLGVTGTILTLALACIFGAIAGGVMAGAAWLRRASGNPDAERAILKAGAPDAMAEPEAESLVSRITAAFQRAEDTGASRGKPVHHLPFGPWIAAGALVVLIFQTPIRTMLANWIM
ncbi:hypothetical protein BH09SUM1_BH09SUM1_29880 [soil metagenome]